MSIANLEGEIFEREGVRVIFRNSITDFKTFTYPYQRRCSDNISLFDFIQTRLATLVNTYPSIIIVDGYGNIPNSRTYMGTVRGNYNR